MEQTPIDLSSLAEPPSRPPLRVLLATTWGIACGISEHAFYLKQAVEAADPTIEVIPVPGALDPDRVDHTRGGNWDVLHLNYHAALHSRWTPKHILDARASGVYKGVITTYHDTGVPNSDQCKAVCAVSDAAVVHEPFDDLEGEIYYWRMGVPESRDAVGDPHSRQSDYPILGTVGFPFPWKCYDELCRVTAKVGWGLMLLAPSPTLTDITRWYGLNPLVEVETRFQPRDQVLADLRTCDATAFTYVCHNTGQSGAILQGIAAKKPVFALSTCRQFRALYDDRLGNRSICWISTFEELAHQLSDGMLHMGRLDVQTAALAHQDRWSEVGKRYSALYRKVAAQR